jgi:hypothetical protein
VERAVSTVQANRGAGRAAGERCLAAARAAGVERGRPRRHRARREVSRGSPPPPAARRALPSPRPRTRLFLGVPSPLRAAKRGPSAPKIMRSPALLRCGRALARYSTASGPNGGDVVDVAIVGAGMVGAAVAALLRESRGPPWAAGARGAPPARH